MSESKIRELFRIDSDKKFVQISTLQKKYNISYVGLKHHYNELEHFKISRNGCVYISEADFLKIKDAFLRSSIRFSKDKFSEFEKRVDEKLGDEYIRLDNISSYRGKIKIYHKTCNRSDYYIVDSILNKNQKCKWCSGSHIYSYEEVKEDIFKRSFGEYSLITDKDNFKGAMKNIELIHNRSDCTYKKPFLTKYNRFIFNEGKCPCCSASKGEMSILTLLEKQNLKEHKDFTKEFIFETTADESISNKRYDFFLNKDKILIEFDGK